MDKDKTHFSAWNSHDTEQNIWNDMSQDTGHLATKDSEYWDISNKCGMPSNLPRLLPGKFPSGSIGRSNSNRAQRFSEVMS